MPVLLSPYVASAPYLDSLTIALSASAVQHAVSSSTSDFLQTVKTYCYVGQYAINSVEMAERLVVIIDSRDTVVVHTLRYLLQSPQTVARPRVVLLSSVQTWGGAKGCSIIEDTSPETFWNRLPSTGEHEIYAIENQFATLLLNDRLLGLEVCIVPVGLIYGGAGGDLAAELDAIWRWESDGSPALKVKSLLQGRNKAPMVHHEDLGRAIAALCTAKQVPLFLPAAGADQDTLLGIFQKVFTTLNGSGSPQTDVEPPSQVGGTRGSSITFVEEAEILDELVAANTPYPRTLLWSADVDFAATSKGEFTQVLGPGLLARLPETWQQFLLTRKLSPISVFVAGTPGAGKTTLAKGICESTGARYVTAEIAIVHAVRYETSGGDDADAGSGSGRDAGLKQELYAALIAELQKSKPPLKKGEVDAPVEIKPATFELTPALLAALPKDVIRRCISAFLRQDSVCVRRGYVLDVWGASELVGSWEDLAGATTDFGPELVVEVQVGAEVLVSRLCASLGIAEGTLAKAPKDQQATVKALEEKLAAYTAKMAPIVYPEAEAAAEGEGEAVSESKSGESRNRGSNLFEQPEFKTSHNAVLNIATSARNVFRINAATSNADDARRALGSQILRVHGTIGWLTAAQVASMTAAGVSVEAETPTTASASAPSSSSSGGSCGTSTQPSIAVAESENPQALSQKRITSTLNEAQGESSAVLVSKANELQHYLLVHVMPELAKGMVHIAQRRPEDPIAFLADHLQALASQREAVAHAKALANFNKLLAVAEGTWVEPELEQEQEQEQEASVIGTASVASADDGIETLSQAGSVADSMHGD